MRTRLRVALVLVLALMLLRVSPASAGGTYDGRFGPITASVTGPASSLEVTVALAETNATQKELPRFSGLPYDSAGHDCTGGFAYSGGGTVFNTVDTNIRAWCYQDGPPGSPRTMVDPVYPIHYGIFLEGTPIAFPMGNPDFDFIIINAPDGVASVAPAVAPQVSVERLASGGYAISWTPVEGATAYQVSYDAPGGSFEQPRGYLFGPSGSTRVLGVVPSAEPLRFVTPDLLTPETNAFALSTAFHVSAMNGVAAGPEGVARAATCASGYFIAARGSGQNPDTGLGAYAQGLGSRALGVYEDARSRLGLSHSMFQANAVNYPAISVGWDNPWSVDNAEYNQSADAGRTAARATVSNILRKCPGSKIVLFGYSQGAHVIGDVFQQLTAGQKAHVLSVQLFADAARRGLPWSKVAVAATDPGITTLPRRLLWAGIEGGGVFGEPRARFTGLTDRGQVESWCNLLDDICHFETILGIRVHPAAAYDCYQLWAARNLAQRARDAGWVSAAKVSEPTSCRLQQY